MKSLILLFPFLLFTTNVFSQALQEVRKDTLLMGSAFGLTALHADKQVALEIIDSAISEIGRLENMISSWNPNSQTSEINRNAGITPVKVSHELFYLIQRCKKISELTNGYFDISFASMDKIWHFDGREMSPPSADSISKSVSFIDHHNIILDKDQMTVFLKEKGMKIGFGAIGKGYAANIAKALMLRMGIVSGAVNAGGDLICWGNHAEDQPWTIAIADPGDRNNALLTLDITDIAVVTSGDYEKYVMIDGERYGHIIDPKSGWPAKGLKSVTVICPDAELADALATSVFVLGVEDGMDLLNQLEGVEGILIDNENKIYYTEQVKTRLIGE